MVAFGARLAAENGVGDRVSEEPESVRSVIEPETLFATPVPVFLMVTVMVLAPLFTAVAVMAAEPGVVEVTERVAEAVLPAHPVGPEVQVPTTDLMPAEVGVQVLPEHELPSQVYVAVTVPMLLLNESYAVAV